MKHSIAAFLVAAMLAMSPAAHADEDEVGGLASSLTGIMGSVDTYVGGAFGRSYYGPFYETDQKLTGYYWMGAGYQVAKTAKFIVAYHGLSVASGGGPSGQGWKLILANQFKGMPDWSFLLGGGFLNDLAAEIVPVEGGSAAGIEVERRLKKAFEFDIGVAWNVGSHTTVGLMVQAVDHDQWAAPLTVKSLDDETYSRVALSVHFFAAVLNLEDLVF